MIFGRRKKRADAELDDAQFGAESGADDVFGPYDAGDDYDETVRRFDCGGLLIPAAAEIELHMHPESDGVFSTVSLVDGGSVMELRALAAPRNEPFWRSERERIRAELRRASRAVEEVDGEYGIELRIGSGGRKAVAIVGIVGPRWLLVAQFSGQAGGGVANAPALLGVLRETVVVRGATPMPPGEPLPLSLPPEIIEQLARDAPDSAVDPTVSAESEPAPTARRTLPKRGVQISEIR